MGISLKSLRLRYGDKLVLDNFSMELPEDGIVALSGPSGCGKTSLIRVMCGLQKPDNGSVEGISKPSLMFQEDRLLPWIDAQLNISVVSDSETAVLLLSKLGLENDYTTMPEQLSGGMKRRVALARAIAYDGDVLLLDEPFKGMDDELKKSVYKLIIQQSQSRLVVVVTHDEKDAEALGAKLIRLTGLPLKILD